MTKEMTDLSTKIDAAVEEYNAKYLANAPVRELSKLDSSIREDVKNWNSMSREETFTICLNSDDPMLTAVKMLTYPTIHVIDKKDKDSGLSTRIIGDGSKTIDPLPLHKASKSGIGHDTKWDIMVEKFGLELTCRVAEDLGKDPTTVNDSYYMSKLARGYDLGENPCSNSKLMTTLTNVVSAMIGDEYRPIKRDEKFLLNIYTKKSPKGPLKVKLASYPQLRLYMMEICHRITEDMIYDMDYQMVKKH